MNTNLSLSCDAIEPSIRTAKFFLPNERIYTLDFDHYIQMQELKLMIQKAAHLRRNNFRLFSNGQEYTQFNEEIFDSLFPHKKFVEFRIEFGDGEENFDETELLLQMNSPCQYHPDKFLLYYCFTCNTSICSECFTNGIHKNHQIQDKCFYLLPSKYLVDKLFENWSQSPYDDYQISVDLSKLKTEINAVMFTKLFEMLKQIQEKCNCIVEEYNQVNLSSLGNIRDSVRDIKVSCIKALDDLKEELNIKDIVNNQQIFVEFDAAYKELGKLQNEKFEKNLVIFEELNKKTSPLVSGLIQRIYSSIHKTLEDCLNEPQFASIKYEINQKIIKPADKNEILIQMSEHKKKRKSFMVPNYPKNSISSISSLFQEKVNSDQGKSITTIQNNININPFIPKDNESFTQQIQNKTMIEKKSNSNTNNINFGYVEKPMGQSNQGHSSLIPTAKFGVNQSNVAQTTIEKKVENINPMNLAPSLTTEKAQNIITNLNSNYGAQVKIDEGNIGPYASAQAKRQVISTNVIPTINIDTSNLFTATTNRGIATFNNTGTTTSNLMTNSNQNININTNNTNTNPFSFGDMNNNNHTSTTTHIIANQNNVHPQIYKTIETKTTTTTTKTIIPNNLISNIIDNNANNRNNINAVINKNPQINHNTIITTYTQNSGLDNFQSYINKKNIIPEEMTESETEIHKPTDVRRFLNTQYILAPVPQTNSIKIITSDNTEERTVPLKFPENFGFNSFFLDCAHCNCIKNRCLYISGGIEPTAEQARSKVLFCVDITKPDELKITKKASMNYSRCGHTMVCDDKYIYCVGGEDLDLVERYDIENDVWEVLPSMIRKRMYPILFIYNGYLYAFFGKFANGEYPCSIERINISKNPGIEKPAWEFVLFSNKNNIDLRYYGCALYETNGLLYFLGGKCNEQTTGKVFFYNFEYRFIEQEDSEVYWREYFRENLLHKLGERYVQCSESKYFGLYLKLQEE